MKTPNTILITLFLGALTAAASSSFKPKDNRSNISIYNPVPPASPDVLPWVEPSPTPPAILEPVRPGDIRMQLLRDVRAKVNPEPDPRSKFPRSPSPATASAY